MLLLSLFTSANRKGAVIITIFTNKNCTSEPLILIFRLKKNKGDFCLGRGGEGGWHGASMVVCINESLWKQEL